MSVASSQGPHGSVAGEPRATNLLPSNRPTRFCSNLPSQAQASRNRRARAICRKVREDGIGRMFGTRDVVPVPIFLFILYNQAPTFCSLGTLSAPLKALTLHHVCWAIILRHCIFLGYYSPFKTNWCTSCAFCYKISRRLNEEGSPGFRLL